MSHSHLSASVASNFNWVLRPDVWVAWVGVLHHHDLWLWLRCHDILDGLAIRTDLNWLLHHWLSLWLELRLWGVWLRLGIHLRLHLVRINWLSSWHKWLLVSVLFVTHVV